MQARSHKKGRKCKHCKGHQCIHEKMADDKEKYTGQGISIAEQSMDMLEKVLIEKEGLPEEILKLASKEELFQLGMDPVCIVAAMGHLDGTRRFVEAGTNSNDKRSTDGSTPLMLASQNGHLEVVELLLKYSADVTVVNNDGNNTFMIAIKTGDAKIVNALWPYRGNLDINHQNKDGYTALHMAADKCWDACVQFLLGNGAAVDAQTSDGWTPLMLAAMKGDVKVIDRLVLAGADLLTEDKSGYTAVCWTIDPEKEDALELLLDKIGEQNIKEAFVKNRLERIKSHMSDEDLESLLADAVLPLMQKLTMKSGYRDILVKQKVLPSVLSVVQKHMKLQEIILASIYVICSSMYHKDSDCIDDRFVKQFVKSRGFEFCLKALKLHNDSNKKDCEILVTCFFPIIIAAEISDGKTWVEKNSAKISNYSFLRDKFVHTVYMTSGKEIWFNFWDGFNAMQQEQRERKMTELLEEEERERNRKMKKRERKKQKRQRQQQFKDREANEESTLINETVSANTSDSDILDLQRETIQHNKQSCVQNNDMSVRSKSDHNKQRITDNVLEKEQEITDTDLKNMKFENRTKNARSSKSRSPVKPKNFLAEVAPKQLDTNRASAVLQENEWVKVQCKKTTLKHDTKENDTLVPKSGIINQEKKIKQTKPPSTNKRWADIAKAHTEDKPKKENQNPDFKDIHGIQDDKEKCIPDRISKQAAYEENFPSLDIQSASVRYSPIPQRSSSNNSRSPTIDYWYAEGWSSRSTCSTPSDLDRTSSHSETNIVDIAVADLNNYTENSFETILNPNIYNVNKHGMKDLNDLWYDSGPTTVENRKNQSNIVAENEKLEKEFVSNTTRTYSTELGRDIIVSQKHENGKSSQKTKNSTHEVGTKTHRTTAFNRYCFNRSALGMRDHATEAIIYDLKSKIIPDHKKLREDSEILEKRFVRPPVFDKSENVQNWVLHDALSTIPLPTSQLWNVSTLSSYDTSLLMSAEVKESINQQPEKRKLGSSEISATAIPIYTELLDNSQLKMSSKQEVKLEKEVNPANQCKLLPLTACATSLGTEVTKPNATSISKLQSISLQGRNDVKSNNVAIIQPIQTSSEIKDCTDRKNSSSIHNTGDKNCALGESLLRNIAHLQTDNMEDVWFPSRLCGDQQEVLPEKYNGSHYVDVFPSFHDETNTSRSVSDDCVFSKMKNIAVHQLQQQYNEVRKMGPVFGSLYYHDIPYYASCLGISEHELERAFVSDPTAVLRNAQDEQSSDKGNGSSNERTTVENNASIMTNSRNNNLFTENVSQTCRIPTTLSHTNETYPYLLAQEYATDTGIHHIRASDEHCARNDEWKDYNIPNQFLNNTVRQHNANQTISRNDAPVANSSTSLSNVIQPWIKKSVRWSQKLAEIRNLPAACMRQIGDILVPVITESFRIPYGEGHAILGFLTDGSEVLVQVLEAAVRTINSDILRSMTSPRTSQYFLMKYRTFASENGYYYVAMELPEFSLNEYLVLLKSDTNADPMVVNKLAWQFLKGLSSLHDGVGWVHGNMMPSNIFVDVEGKLLLSEYSFVQPDSSKGKFLGFSAIEHDRSCWTPSEVITESAPYTLKSDIQVAGMILHYILSGGHHPYGEINLEIQVSLQQNWPKTTYISEEVNGLINDMLVMPPAARPSMDQILKHPYFWANEKRLRFVLIAGSDVLRDMKSGTSTTGGTGGTMIDIINNLGKNSMFCDWTSMVDHVILKEMRSFRQYKNTLVELVLFVYNCCLHFDKLSQTARDIIDEPCKYFLTTFPALFMAVYIAIKNSSRADRVCYKPFF